MLDPSSTELLKRDHRVIERVLGSLERIVEKIRRGGEVPVELIDEALLFSQTFIDKCHHGKEEVCLFPCMEKRGIPREGGPIGVMLVEHQIGREMVMKIREALLRHEKDTKAREDVTRICSDYVVHLRQHIFKEENILFQMGGGVMNDDDHKTTVECYERTEEERVGVAGHEEMLRLAEKLAPV